MERLNMATHYRGKRQEINALNTFIKITRCADSLTQRLNPVLTKAGLTESQFGIIDLLFHQGPLSQKEIGDKLLKSGGNITMVLDNLEKRNLIRRERNKVDRRYFTIHLTDEGKQLHGQAFPLFLSALLEETKVLTEEEHHSVQLLCKILGKKLLRD